MKKRVISRAGIAVVLLLLIGLVGCVLPSDQPTGKPPEGTYSTADLLANLDTLQGPVARSLTVAGKSVFTLPGQAARDSGPDQLPERDKNGLCQLRFLAGQRKPLPRDGRKALLGRIQ